MSIITRSFWPLHWQYFLTVWALSIPFKIFYREIDTSGFENVSKGGTTLFVAAPHSNDVLDTLAVAHVLRGHVDGPVSFLVAETVMKRRFISAIAKAMHTIIIRRLWDGAVLGSGTVYAPDFRTNPRLLKGNDTRFDLEAEVGGFVLLVIGARRILRCEILEIRGPQELYLKTAFIQDEKEEVLPNLSKGASESLAAALTGTLYSLAPKHAPLDISKTVHSRLAHGGAACLFPEGIAHDQSDLLPLKTGAAVMALSFLANGLTTSLNLVPCALHHTNADRFRSRIGVEFGEPIEISHELVEKFRMGKQREAARELTNVISHRLKKMTLTNPEVALRESAQHIRRLYNPASGLWPIHQKMALNRKILRRLCDTQHETRTIDLLNKVNNHVSALRDHGIRSYQVRYAILSAEHAAVLFAFQLCKFTLACLITAPGFITFAPIMMYAGHIGKIKARAIVRSSPFRREGRDVVAAWKGIVGIALLVPCYAFYAVAVACLAPSFHLFGDRTGFTSFLVNTTLVFVLLLAATYISLYTGDYAVDMWKTFRLFLLLVREGSALEMREIFRSQENLICEVGVLIDDAREEEHCIA